MQLGELSSIVQTVLTWLTSWWGVIGPIVGVVAGLLFLWGRTGSTHMLTSRLCQLILGKRAFKSPVVDQFLDERDALMHFRTATSLRKVGTVAVAERLIEFTRAHEIDIDLVSGAGHYFDVEKPGFTRSPPGQAKQIGFVFAASAFGYAALIVLVFGIVTPPVIKVIKTDTWYAASPDGTHKFKVGHQNKPKFSFEQCQNKAAISSTTGYPAYDVDVLCEALSTDAGKKQLHGAQVGQWVGTIFAFIPLGLFAALFFRLAGQASKATKLYKKVAAAEKTNLSP